MKSSKPTIRVIDALQKARAIFKRHRWIQEAPTRLCPTAGYCLLGAIDKAHGVVEGAPHFGDGKVKGSIYVARAIKELFPARYMEKYFFSGKKLKSEDKVIEFNDHSDTSRKDVLKVLDRAIELVEEQINR